MKNKKKLVIWIFIFIVLLVGAKFITDKLDNDDNFVVQPDNQTTDKEQQYQKAIDFTVYDPELNPVTLSSFYGKPIVISFWATWCPNCTIQMPGFNELYLEYGGKVEFLMINLTDGEQDTREKAIAYMNEKGYQLPYYLDTTLEAASIYGASSIPITYLIDQNQNVIASGVGAISKQSLQDAISTYIILD